MFSEDLLLSDKRLANFIKKETTFVITSYGNCVLNDWIVIESINILNKNLSIIDTQANRYDISIEEFWKSAVPFDWIGVFPAFDDLIIGICDDVYKPVSIVETWVEYGSGSCHIKYNDNGVLNTHKFLCSCNLDASGFITCSPETMSLLIGNNSTSSKKIRIMENQLSKTCTRCGRENKILFSSYYCPFCE